MDKDKRKKSISKIYGSFIIPNVIFFILIGLLVVQQTGVPLETQAFSSDLFVDEEYSDKINRNIGNVSENSDKCLLVYDPKDEESTLVYENIKYVLNSLFADVYEQKIDISDEADYSKNKIKTIDRYNSVIICSGSLEAFDGFYPQVEPWLKNGGKLMLSGGLAVSEKDSQSKYVNDWKKLLGIKEEAVKVDSIDSLRFKNSFLAGAEDRAFSSDVIEGTALYCKLNTDCSVYAETDEEDETPLIWTRDVGEGRLLVCNADLMDSKADRGIITAAYCSLFTAYAYPVIDAAVYCIDDFPSPAPAGYDKNVLQQYGYTVNDFIINVWMPKMFELSERNNIPYSAFAIQTYEADNTAPFNNYDNQTEARYCISELLKRGGEIGIHGYNHQPLVLDGYEFAEENGGYTAWNSISDMIESIETVMEYLREITDDVEVQSYVAPSNILSNESYEAITSRISDIRIFAGIYIGTDDQLVQEFDSDENGIVSFPRLTADMQMEDSEWWLQINEMNYHYVEANFIHPDDILDEERNNGGNFEDMLEGYEAMVKWNNSMQLEACTISNAAEKVQRYVNISVDQELTEDGMKLHISGLIDKASVMLRTDGREPNVKSGAEIKKIDEGVYVLTVTSEEIEIKW